LITATLGNITYAQPQNNVSTQPLMKATWIVDNEGDGDFTSIQDALNTANAADIIEVYSGTYTEKISIDKEIELIGIDTEYMTGSDTGKPVIDGDNDDNVITIFTDGSNKPITISGFEIRNSGDRDSGIFIDFSVDIMITDNLFSNNHHGIYVYHSCTTIDENEFNNNDWGILTEFSDHCIITENMFFDNNIGYQLESSHAVDISRNSFENNTEYGLVLIRSPINEITFNNFVNNGRNAWFKNCLNKWNDNYWGDRPISLPFYIILGELQSTVFPALRIPIPQFDLRAKSSPI
jgi:parallel beta-helix repeat protein